LFTKFFEDDNAMATGDLYRCKLNFSTNNRAWSVGIHIQEVDPISEEGFGDIVAHAVAEHFVSQLVVCLTSDSAFESVETWKIYQAGGMPGMYKLQGGVGNQPADSLPNDNALVLQLRQSAGPARFNGKQFYAGQSDTNISGNDWLPSYLSTNVELLALRYLDTINAVSPEGGAWRVVILSKAFDPPTLPIGTPLDLTSVVPSTRALTQKRRRQRVQGLAPSVS
jgi:hypothetical protein